MYRNMDDWYYRSKLLSEWRGFFWELRYIEAQEKDVARLILREWRPFLIGFRRLNEKEYPRDICGILRYHAKILEDDSERLTTTFLKNLISGEATNCED